MNSQSHPNSPTDAHIPAGLRLRLTRSRKKILIIVKRTKQTTGEVHAQQAVKVI
ncbi:hypothetical protein ACE6H2_013549 [Prunus campanulata]